MPVIDQELYGYMGIDPGQGGGIAVLGPNSKCLFAVKIPQTERDVWELVDIDYTCIAIIEKVHSMPKQGVASSFKFGRSYGFLRGCLIASGIPFDEVTPQAWQKGLEIPKRQKSESNTQWKNRLKAKAQQLFPSEQITLATADALLIAEYCRRKHKGLLNG